MSSTKKAPFLEPGDRLKIALDELKISQAMAAKRVFVSPGQISKWILKQNAITDNAAAAFEGKLYISQQWLMHGEGDMRLMKVEYLPSDMKMLADLWPRISDRDRRYIIGIAQGIVAGKAVK